MADYESNFDTDSETEEVREKKRRDLVLTDKPSKKSRPNRDEFISEAAKEEGRKRFVTSVEKTNGSCN